MMVAGKLAEPPKINYLPITFLSRLSLFYFCPSFKQCFVLLSYGYILFVMFLYWLKILLHIFILPKILTIECPNHSQYYVVCII